MGTDSLQYIGGYKCNSRQFRRNGEGHFTGSLGHLVFVREKIRKSLVHVLEVSERLTAVCHLICADIFFHISCRLQHKDVFALIRKYDLYNDIHRMIIPLFQLDKAKTIAMLKEKNKISTDIVVQQLEPRQDFLFAVGILPFAERKLFRSDQSFTLFFFLQYLDALDIEQSGRYHSKLVNLYAKYDPKKLLSFLKRSNNYPIQEALDICKGIPRYEEMIYLLGRMGNTSEALSIIIHKLKNIQTAIDFCKEHDDMDLWNDLINQSLDRPDMMTKLLDGIVGKFILEPF